ncbi:MAG TPA: outer membrane beta-barrel protein [Steroidobacteraceae bacterium]|jgi:hypothetical protein|nr:outer membrane beta-barrel protein [Steroidobacteraceae bacterium]
MRKLSFITERRAAAALALGTLAATLAGGPGVAFADDGPYVGAGGTQVELNDIYGVGLYLHHPVVKWIAGYRFLDFLGVELNYANLGAADAALLDSYSFGYAHADAKEYSAYAVGYLPLPLVDLFAKAGVMHYELRSNAEVLGTSPYSIDASGQQFAWGVGGQMHFGPFAPRLEWEHSNLPYSSSLNLWTVGLTFTF